MSAVRPVNIVKNTNNRFDSYNIEKSFCRVMQRTIICVGAAKYLAIIISRYFGRNLTLWTIPSYRPKQGAFHDKSLISTPKSSYE